MLQLITLLTFHGHLTYLISWQIKIALTSLVHTDIILLSLPSDEVCIPFPLALLFLLSTPVLMASASTLLLEGVVAVLLLMLAIDVVVLLVLRLWLLEGVVVEVLVLLPLFLSLKASPPRALCWC